MPVKGISALLVTLSFPGVFEYHLLWEYLMNGYLPGSFSRSAPGSSLCRLLPAVLIDYTLLAGTRVSWPILRRTRFGLGFLTTFPPSNGGVFVELGWKEQF